MLFLSSEMSKSLKAVVGAVGICYRLLEVQVVPVLHPWELPVEKNATTPDLESMGVINSLRCSVGRMLL